MLPSIQYHLKGATREPFAEGFGQMAAFTDSDALADHPGIPAPTPTTAPGAAAAASQPHSRDPAPTARSEGPTGLNAGKVRLCRYFGMASGTSQSLYWFHIFIIVILFH
jgi:hypothetical protein